MKRVLFIPIAILGVGVAVVWVLWLTRPMADPTPVELIPPLIRVQTLGSQELQLVVKAQGTVAPRTESELKSQVSGEVLWVSPALVPGGFFDSGDRLLKIDPVDYEADLESARARLARAQSEAGRARKENARQRRLADRSVSSQARIDDAENGAHVAEAGLREAEAQLGRAERDLERTVVYAPYPGRVRSERVDLGQFIARGESLARIYAVDYAEVRLPIPDRELRYLDLPLGYRESVATDSAATEEAYPVDQLAEVGSGTMYGPQAILRAEFAGKQHAWAGRIVRTEGEIDPKSRMVTVVARVEDPYGRRTEDGRPPLAVGLFVEVEISGRILPEAIVIPRSALRQGSRVLVLDSGNRLHYRPISVLRTERELVIVEDGLQTGERVAVSPMPDAIEGMSVRPKAEERAQKESGPS
ncbi:MAG TPA: efflux RND transporter periplasmic adaptor subunit [Myxococcales bacterium]|nr:efflux RND transporter periplasmic adaptor subunit [Myxococcales bacterium]